MPISTTCPHCAASENFPDTSAGTTVHCSACGGAINLPAKARPVVAAVVAQAKPIAAVAVPVKAKSKPIVELDEDEEEEVRPRKKSKPAVDLDEEEERPRKKSKPAVDLDDEPRPAPPKKGSQAEFSFDEDEERPKKKKPRRRDDDEDEDERPRRKPAPKKGGSKLLLILGGIGFVLFAACAGIGGYVYVQMDKAVASVKSQMTEPETSRPTTKANDGKPDVKGNAAKLTNGDTYATATTKMGLGSDCRIEDLQDMIKRFKDPNGPDKGLLQFILDQYAPWVAKDCAKLYWDGAKYRALVVFSKPNPQNNKSATVRGLLTLNESGTRTSYNERIVLTRDVDSDPDAQALKLKHWTDLKEEGTIPTPMPNPVPPKPEPVPPMPEPTPGVVKLSATDFAAEVIKDRNAAKKKYAGVTLEITGEVNSKSGTGGVLILKAGNDENSGKPMTLPITMKPDHREGAKKCNPGDMVTVTGSLGAISPLGYAFPLTNGILKK